VWNADNDVYICIVEDAFMLYITEDRSEVVDGPVEIRLEMLLHARW